MQLYQSRGLLDKVLEVYSENAVLNQLTTWSYALKFPNKTQKWRRKLSFVLIELIHLCLEY